MKVRKICMIGMFTLLILCMMNTVRASVDYNVDDDGITLDVLMEINGNTKLKLNVSVIEVEEGDVGDMNDVLSDESYDFDERSYDPELTWDDYIVVENMSYLFYAYQGERANLSEGIQPNGVSNYYWYYYISYETINSYYADRRYTAFLEQVIIVLIFGIFIVSAALMIFVSVNRKHDLRVEIHG